MPISFTCPHCKVKMTVPDKFAGVKTKCPSCSEPIIISDLAPAAPQPAQPAPQAPQQKESRDWYDKMTGSDEGTKNSLDKMHRDTNVDLSEFVTRWTGEEDGIEELEPETRKRPSKSMPAATRQSRQSSESRSGQRHTSADAPPPSSNVVFFVGGIVVVLVVVVVLMFVFKKEQPKENNNNSSAVTESPEPGNPEVSSQPKVSGSSVEPTPTATPEPTEKKTASPEDTAKKDLAFANDAFDRFEFANAIRLYKKYLEFDSKNEEVWLRLVECHVRTKNKVDALETIAEAIKNVGETYKILRIEVDLEMELERLDEGIATYDKLVKIAPEDEKESLLLEVFQMLLMQGEERKSKEMLDKAWEYLQMLKPYMSEEDNTFYKETLKEAFGNAGFNAPF